MENGGLVYTGQLNLGSTGTMRIHDAARLTAVLVDTDAPPRITAGGGITFDGDEELFVQVAQGISATDESTWLDGFDDTGTSGTNPIANGTTVTGRTGQVALRTARGPSTVVEVGHIPLENGATKTTDTSVTSGVRLGVFGVDAPADRIDVTDPGASPGIPDWSPGAGGGGLVLGRGLGALGSALFGMFDAMPSSFACAGRSARRAPRCRCPVTSGPAPRTTTSSTGCGRGPEDAPALAGGTRRRGCTAPRWASTGR